MKKTLLFILGMTLFSSFAQNVNIPDANFKAYLVGNTAINTNGDTEIQETEAQAFTGKIDCSQLSISDMTGVEKFTALTELWCINNPITALDVSQNTALTDLRCSTTDITSIDVSLNLALTTLHVQATDITSLDVSNNTALTELLCYVNDLTSLDVSQNTALESLMCFDNQLTNLDVSLNTALVVLNCKNNDLTSLNVSQNSSLELLVCFDNNLGTIDVSQNTALTLLSCGGTGLTALDVSANINLTTLNCQQNELTQMDLSNHTALNALRIWDNDLLSLNIANGNNSSFTVFEASLNPNLTCIEVDDSTYSAQNWTIIDAQSSFSENCSGTGIGINEIDHAQVKLYPNPTLSNLFIESEEAVSTFMILDVTGKQVLEGTQTPINVSDLKSGVYFIKLYTQKGMVTKRFIKE